MKRKKKLLTRSNKEIAGITPSYRHYETCLLLPDMRRELTYEDEIKIEQRISKCQEIIIKFNNTSVAALVDTGSAINGLSEELSLIHI